MNTSALAALDELVREIEDPELPHVTIGDLGIVRGVERLHNLRKTPTPKRMEQLGAKWRPYRSVAAWYLWAAANA